MTNPVEKYNLYKAADFFADESFIESHLQVTEEENSFWIELGLVYPHLVPEMQLAASWISIIKNQPTTSGSLSSEQRWENIQNAIPSYERRQRNIDYTKNMVKWTLRIAAALLCVVLFYEISQFGTKSTRTAFGEQRELELPDASIVNLNSNSKISFVRNWKSDQPREISLEGEAMFDVKHTAITNRIQEKDHFIVRVGDFKLTVLGTKFNVKHRGERIEIALYEGKLHVLGKGNIETTLLPGDLFVYDPTEKTVTQEKKDLNTSSAWLRGELNLEHANLSNIIEVLKDLHGYEVDVRDSALFNRRLTGVIPTKNIDDILFVLKHTLNITSEKHDNKIIINSNKTTNN